jgi:AcrR family transcriptional regulator
MSDSRDLILDAAEALIGKEGVKKLTIENVAAAAGLSRGGVLYHFASKEALIQGMLDRMNRRFEAIIEDEIARDPEPHGRWTRAFARAALRMDEQTTSVFAPLIAAISYEPKLLEEMQANQNKWQVQTEAELDPVKAAVVRLASNALWYNDLFSMNNYTPEQKRAIIEWLTELTLP